MTTKRTAVLLLLAVSLTGCFGGTSDKVATANTPAATVTASAPAVPTSTTSTAKTFSECMADHGVDVPEPEPGKGLAGIDPALAETPAFKTALEACKNLIQGGVRSSQPQDMDKYLAFAKCMRGNGLPDFPDPKPGDKNGLFGGSNVDRNSPAFQKASKACTHVLSGAAG
ncbi:hypothetical protein [Kribbella kalugense]|nr:hypothetical protein [Kribbella kalugense]